MIDQSTIEQMALAILRVNHHNTEGHIPPYLMADALRDAQAAASVLAPMLADAEQLLAAIRDAAPQDRPKVSDSARNYELAYQFWRAGQMSRNFTGAPLVIETSQAKAESLVTALEDISAMSLSSVEAETELRRAGSLAREAVRAYQGNQ